MRPEPAELNINQEWAARIAPIILGALKRGDLLGGRCLRTPQLGKFGFFFASATCSCLLCNASATTF